jgi:hypothetical protein
LFDSYPELFAVFHARHRLLTPRHPPCALSSLTTNIQNSTPCSPAAFCCLLLLSNCCCPARLNIAAQTRGFDLEPCSPTCCYLPTRKLANTSCGLSAVEIRTQLPEKRSRMLSE